MESNFITPPPTKKSLITPGAPKKPSVMVDLTSDIQLMEITESIPQLRTEVATIEIEERKQRYVLEPAIVRHNLQLTDLGLTYLSKTLEMQKQFDANKIVVARSKLSGLRIIYQNVGTKDKDSKKARRLRFKMALLNKDIEEARQAIEINEQIVDALDINIEDTIDEGSEEF